MRACFAKSDDSPETCVFNDPFRVPDITCVIANTGTSNATCPMWQIERAMRLKDGYTHMDSEANDGSD